MPSLVCRVCLVYARELAEHNSPQAAKGVIFAKNTPSRVSLKYSLIVSPAFYDLIPAYVYEIFLAFLLS